MRDFNNSNDSGNIRTRPYGSSSLAVSVAIVVIVGALLIIGGVLIYGARGNGDDDDTSAAAATTVDFDPVDPTDTVPALPTTEDATETEASTPSPAEEPSATPPPTATIDSVATEQALIPTETPTEEEALPTATEVVEEPTDEPIVEPTSEIDEPSQPTVEPAIGDFGELPPAQLPSGGASSSMSLVYELGMSLDALPAEASAYLIEWPIYSLEEVQNSADQLELAGEAVELDTGVYRVEGEAGALYVSPSEIVFSSYVEASGELPGEGGVTSAAAEWLSLSGFVTSNIDGGTVVGWDDESLRAIVVFRPAEPSPNLAPTPSATVTVGPGGEVLEARIHWPLSVIPSSYGLKAPSEIWRSVQNGNGFLEADLSQVSASGFLSGTATLTDYSIAYTLASGPGGQYLVPVVQFHGTALIEQSGEEIPVSVSVPSVYHQTGSFG